MNKRLIIILVAIGLLLIASIVASTTFTRKIEGDAMLPTLHDGETILFNKLSGGLKRGDIVVFRAPEGENIIKRVIAVEGDSMAIKHDPNPYDPIGNDCGGCGVYVNGVKLDEPYIKENPSYDFQSTKVLPGQVFVLGDNRNNSSDSHIWGMLPVDRIAGIAMFR